MVVLVKHEWHQVDSQFAYELDIDKLAEIYPDMKKRELNKLFKEIANGEYDIDQLMSDAWDNDVEIDWDRQRDDWWTDRKGGYEITYEYGDLDSWHHEPEPTPPTHKCTKCRWDGNRWEANTVYCRADGTVIEYYYTSDEESDHTREICPMCDSDTELTEQGIKEKQERLEREAFWAKEEKSEIEEAIDDVADEITKMALENLSENGESLEGDSCYSCDKLVQADELITMDGQDHCPHCGEGWIDMDNRE
jgi:predicted RNA-binding Zn-ribbon protein involved in translation (DUF1610 family)